MAFGYGKCEKTNDDHFNGKPFCYANLPSSCDDLKDSDASPGKQMSAQACAGGYSTSAKLGGTEIPK